MSLARNRVKIEEFVCVGEDNKPVKRYGLKFPHRRRRYVGPGPDGGAPSLTEDIVLVSVEKAFLFTTQQKAADWATSKGLTIVQ